MCEVIERFLDVKVVFHVYLSRHCSESNFETKHTPANLC